METNQPYAKEVAPFIEIPTYDYPSSSWTSTVFYTREEFREFALTLFKEPGKYEFDECSTMFIEQARRFDTDGFYCNAPFRSKDFTTYWETEKSKCRTGVIFKNGNKTWYLTRQYYMWLNFLPIFDKEQAKVRFPDVRDAQ